MALTKPSTRRAAIARPSGGTSAGLKDYLATLARGSLRFIVWFFTGGIGADGAPLFDTRRLTAFALVRVLLVMMLVVLATWGLAHPALSATMIGALLSLGLYAFTARSHARDTMYFAATRDVAEHPPLPQKTVVAPKLLAARPLQQLSLGVDRLRRGDARGALDAVRDVDEHHLERDELRMLGAVHALAAHALGDKKSAALGALAAFPTGALPIDEQLGQVCIDGAWHDGSRLAAILDGWRSRGVHEADDTRLGQLVRFARVKLGQIDASALHETERQALASYCRQIGDVVTERAVSSPLVPSTRAYR